MAKVLQRSNWQIVLNPNIDSEESCLALLDRIETLGKVAGFRLAGIQSDATDQPAYHQRPVETKRTVR